MRSEKEMFNLILETAQKDERVRAVALNGSRTNPNVPKDRFQDFDIVYLVSEMDSFINDINWIDIFGERIIMQTPENMSMFPPSLGGRFTYLMQFSDGNRIDLMLIPIEEKDIYCLEDKLTVILMDKDNILPYIQTPSDKDYWVKCPSNEFFQDCCNEFWWVSTYIAKGLWRNEIIYAQDHLNNYVRPMLIKMLEWEAGIKTDFSVSIGKNAKYLDKYISNNSWNKLLSTYAKGNCEDIWRALFITCELFRDTANVVARKLGYIYPIEDDNSVTNYLYYVKDIATINE